MQSTNKILMIKPVRFDYNEETAKDNLYQNQPDLSSNRVQENALKEFNNMVSILQGQGIQVNILEDKPSPHTPDSIFPNNWFSTHDGILIIYPMYAENRREEIYKFKDDLIELYQPNQVFDFSSYAYQEGKFLESTGAMIFDRDKKEIYSCLSQRSDEELINKVAKLLNYKTNTFKAYHLGSEIYHTNVLMSITSNLVFICPELLDEKDRSRIISKLTKDRKLIELTPDQVLKFGGNVLELKGSESNFIAISQTAYDSLTDQQIETINTYNRLVPIPVPTIEELGGGSVRCMIAELH